MQKTLDVEFYIVNVVDTLQQAGYETYIVGGAIRDLLMHRAPKDYDISTAATPEQVRDVFGRRRARIIGKRFQLVHLSCGREILEISTFRRAPRYDNQEPLTPGAKKIAALAEAQNMIFSDNDFGTAVEDAWRRDFTVNALFYDPVTLELYDHTGYGVADIESGVVRAIGEDPTMRFEEDPVRILRALKLVGQYGFVLEAQTEVALRNVLPMITLASSSRLSLELEKILKSAYCERIFRAFSDYDFLPFFLPVLGDRSRAGEFAIALKLLGERDRRVRAGYYRASVSLALATLVLPFMEARGKKGSWDEEVLRRELLALVAPMTLVRRMSDSACRILRMQPLLRDTNKPVRLVKLRGFAHAFELIKIQHDSAHCPCSDDFIGRWREILRNRDPQEAPEAGGVPEKRRRRRRGSAPVAP